MVQHRGKPRHRFHQEHRTKQQFRHLCRTSNKVCWYHWETKTFGGEKFEGPLDLISYIVIAQQDGKLSFVPLEEEFIMGISKYYIKVSTSDQYGVLRQLGLCLIIWMVCFHDSLEAGKSFLALKTTDASNQEYSLWVYQCNSLEQAQVICKVLPTAFNSLLTSEKTWLLQLRGK